MHTIYFAGLVAMLTFSVTAPAQSVCGQPDNRTVEALLVICTEEGGMAPRPQPRLFLGVFTDGRAEYERNPSGDGPKLVRKAIQLRATEFTELLRLGRERDFQEAAAEYDLIHTGSDSSRRTTVVFREGGSVKRVILNNYAAGRDDNGKHYPLSLNSLMEHVQLIRERAEDIVREVPTITFCELTENASKYRGKKIRMYADIEHHVITTRDGKRSHIVEYFQDAECRDRSGGSADEQPERVGVAYPDDAALTARLKNEIAKLRREPFNGRARVLVEGFVRSTTPGPLVPYAFDFDLYDIKSMARIIIPYRGRLINGRTYSDTFDHARGSGIKLSSPLQPKLHRTEIIEWKYAGHPELQRPGRKHIVFKVIYTTVQALDKYQWRETYTCDILEIK